MEMSLFQMLLFFLIVIFSRISLIASSIEQIQVRENVNVTITCQFEKSKSLVPAFEPAFLSRSSEHIILWYKDETDVIGVNSISNDPKKYSIVQQNRHTYQLTIINARLESSGVYKCQNFTAKEENRFQLNVIGKWESCTLFWDPSKRKSLSTSLNTHIRMRDVIEKKFKFIDFSVQSIRAHICRSRTRELMICSTNSLSSPNDDTLSNTDGTSWLTFSGNTIYLIDLDLDIITKH